MTEQPHDMDGRQFRRRWTLGRKIAGLTAVLLALPLIGTLVQVNNLRDVGRQLDEISTTLLPVTLGLVTAHGEQLQQHIAMEQALRAAAGGDDGAAALATTRAQFDELGKSIDEALAGVRAVAASVDGDVAVSIGAAGIITAIDELVVAHAAFEQHVHDVLEQTRSASGDRGQRLIDDVEREAQAIDEGVEALLASIEAEVERSAARAAKAESFALSTSVVAALLSLVLGIALSWIIIRALTAPLREFCQRAMRIAGGDLTGSEIPVRTTDEVGELTVSFNAMLQSMRLQVSDTQSAVETLAAATAQIVAAVQQQAASTKEQAATVQEVTSTMQELGQSGTQIVERATSVSDSAQSSATAGQTGLEAVEQASQGMESIREQVEEVAENIVLLSEKTQAVGEIIAAVNEIAEQSNLLALNAAIEATSAGDHGSRFAVVANEMKNLADNAKQSTAQVRSILGEIHKGINSAVMLTEEAVKRVELGKQRTRVMEGTIRDFAGSTRQSVDTFQQIIAGTNQQQIGFEQVTRAMQDIREASDQTSSSSTQLETAVADLAAMGRQIRGTVERYQLTS